MRLATIFLIICLAIITMASGCIWMHWNQQKESKTAVSTSSQPNVTVNTDNQAAEHTTFELKPEPLLSPGQYQLTAPKAKVLFLIWVPYDYNHDYLWPVIFCYHGAGGSMTTWPFHQVTRGRGFIIVGMNYIPWESGRRNMEWLNKEKDFFFEALAMVSARLNVDPEMVFMGGYSQGGYHTTLLGEQILDKLAGLIILGAGRYWVEHTPPPPAKIRGKPVFIGAGEKDTVHNPRAKQAAQNYKHWGAKVTFEEWPGVEHGIRTPEFPSKMLLNWLEGIFGETP